MTELSLLILYRIITVLGGIMSIFLGYKLFARAHRIQGEFQVKGGKEYQVKLSQFAPGIFFALFGAFVLTMSLVKDVSWSSESHKVEPQSLHEQRPITIPDSERNAIEAVIKDEVRRQVLVMQPPPFDPHLRIEATPPLELDAPESVVPTKPDPIDSPGRFRQ